MAVTPEEVRRIAKLAKLTFSEKEMERLAEELSRVLDHVRALEKAPLDGLEPMAHPFDAACPMREDVSAPSLSNEDVLRNAPEPEGGAFKVPEVIESK
jgi:aspartyl-tRNA(Asn)/glutamyl-tRNA(Gln) amidotransferase subunit C